MKTKIILILILLSTSSTFFGQVTFSHANISTAKSQASSSNLPYFVYISGDWCLPCQIMEETTFKSLDLQDAIDQKYTAYKVDFHSKEGEEWVAAHDICCLPTFLFFDEQGNKTQEIQSPLTASKFIKVLDSPQSYSKQDKEFANANSSNRLKSQLSNQDEIVDSEKAITTNLPENSFGQNSTVEVGIHSEYEDTSTPNVYNNSSKGTIETVGIEGKSVFLHDLRKHITSLEAIYAKYELEEDEAKKLNNVSPLAQMEGFSSDTDAKLDCECENVTKNAQELAQMIKELKIWEVQLEAIADSPTLIQTKNKVNSNKTKSVISPKFISNSSEERIYFSVQMGMFKTEAYARRMVEDLAKSYTYSIEMKQVDKLDNTLYRVLLGPFVEESEAKEIYSIMKRDGRKAVVGMF